MTFLLVSDHDTGVNITFRCGFVIATTERIDTDIAVVVLVEQIVNANIRLY